MTDVLGQLGPVPQEFITPLEGEGNLVYGRMMCAAGDISTVSTTARSHGMRVVDSATKGQWGFVEYEGSVADLRGWLPEHEIRRYWFPPLPASVALERSSQE